jgi:hypothetical protein
MGANVDACEHEKQRILNLKSSTHAILDLSGKRSNGEVGNKGFGSFGEQDWGLSCDHLRENARQRKGK